MRCALHSKDPPYKNIAFPARSPSKPQVSSVYDPSHAFGHEYTALEALKEGYPSAPSSKSCPAARAWPVLGYFGSDMKALSVVYPKPQKTPGGWQRGDPISPYSPKQGSPFPAYIATASGGG